MAEWCETLYSEWVDIEQEWPGLSGIVSRIVTDIVTNIITAIRGS